MSDSSKKNFDENDIPRMVRELPPLEADADFRARLRSAFAEGRLEAEPTRGRFQPGPSRDMARAKKGRRLAWWCWAVPAAAAAAVVFAVVTLNRAPQLRVTQVTGRGEVRVDGLPVPLDDTAALNASIRAGSEIETPPGALVDLMAKDMMLVEITGGTRMSIPAMPGRWFARAVECSLSTGEMRFISGRRFPGSELLVMTPEGRIEIAGTMLSIERDAGGTCVCVVEGVAYVGMNQNDMEPVKAGYRKVMLPDHTAKILPIAPPHREGVLDFDSRLGDRITR
jgi:ferric-dicitrate binding protein FerR (iron transport regulator)